MKLFIALFLNLSFFTWATKANSSSRASVLMGIGQASVTSAEPGAARVENPIGLGFFIDHPYKGSYSIFAEHMRSSAGGSTSVGLTGAGLKYYPWLNPAHFSSTNKDSITSSIVKHSGYAIYFAGSGGFAQASIPSKGTLNSALAAGIYINGKAGLEYPMGASWGLKGEGNFSSSVAGAGAISYFNMILGAYFDL